MPKITPEWNLRREFINRFCNDHNGKPRFLRGIFLDDEDEINQMIDFALEAQEEARKEGHEAGLKAGKKVQEIEDMQLLGALIVRMGGEVLIYQNDLLTDYWVERTTDMRTGGIVLRALTDNALSTSEEEKIE